MKIKNLFLAAAAMIGIAFTASAADVSYHHHALLATNTYIAGSSTVTQGVTSNLVSANYAFGSASIPIPGNGVFELKPGAQNQSFSGQNGPQFTFIYREDVTNAGNTNVFVGQTLNVIANIGLIPDDYCLSKGFVTPASVYVTNTCAAIS